MSTNRQLAAIMFTDIVGYSAIMNEDEARALTLLNKNRKIQSKLIKRFHGRWLKEIGDGVLASFTTVTNAVYCAAAIQQACENESDLKLRIGIHQGEIVFENDDVFGDGVNIASRIESLAQPGAILVSTSVYQNISNNREIEATFIEDASLKNISYKVGIYSVKIPNTEYLNSIENVAHGSSLSKNKWWQAATIIIVIIGIIGVIMWFMKPDAARSDATGPVLIEDSDQIIIGEALALPSGPRIAVLPFNNLSSDQDQAYFSDGLTEDIITALSRTDLFVLGFSSKLHNLREMSVRAIGQELGVRYLLRGSVRRDSNTIKVSGQLFDTDSGKQIWGESYSRDLTMSDIFEIQDDITTRVVGTIADGGVIARLSMEELKRNPTKVLAAYECVLRSYAYEELHTAEAHLRARDCVESAIELDSNYADALGIAAYLYREEHFHDFNQRPAALEHAMISARRAIEIDPLNQNAYHALAFIYADLGISNLNEFFIAAKQAIAINPNNTRVIGAMGALIAYAGEWEWGIDLLEKTMSVNPYSQLNGWLHFTKATNFFRQGSYSDALIEINQSPIRLPVAKMNIIAIHAQLDNQEKATSVLRAALTEDPMFLENAQPDLEKFYLVDTELRTQILEGLGLAASWMEE